MTYFIAFSSALADGHAVRRTTIQEIDSPATDIFTSQLGPDPRSRRTRSLQQQHLAASRRGLSARSEPGPTVDQFSADVQVTGVARGLLDHVQHYPSHVRRFILRIAVLATGGCGQWRHGKHLIGARALIAVEPDDLRGRLVSDEGSRWVIRSQV